MNDKTAAPVEFTDAYFTVSTLTDGRLTVKLQGHPIASLPGSNRVRSQGRHDPQAGREA